MTELTDDELEFATTVGTRYAAANQRAYVDSEMLKMSSMLQRAALEIRRRDIAEIVLDDADIERLQKMRDSYTRIVRHDYVRLIERLLAAHGAKP